jgi:hypothetical protein
MMRALLVITAINQIALFVLFLAIFALGIWATLIGPDVAVYEAARYGRLVLSGWSCLR